MRWRRALGPFGGGPRAAHAGLGHEARSPPRRLLASEPRGPATLSKPGGGVSKGPYWRGRPGGRRRVRDPWGSALRNAVRPGETPRWGPRKVSPFPTPDRRRHVPENRDRGIALPPPPGDYWHRSTPGGRLHGRGRAGRAPTSTEDPEAPRRVRSPRECVGRVRRSTGRRVHPSPQADGFNGHNVVVELGPVGAGRLAVAGY